MNLHPIEAALLSDFTAKTINGLISKGYNWLKGDINTYQQELRKVINAAIESYQTGYKTAEIDKIAFTNAQIFIEELVNYQFDLPVDSQKIRNAIEQDNRVQLPTDEEVSKFLSIFNEHISSSPNLKKLYIKDNHEEISFRALCGIELANQKLDLLIAQTQTSVKTLEIENALAAEWTAELVVIKQLLYQFKPKTAAELVASLHERIAQRNIKHDLLESQLAFLMAQAISDSDNFATTAKSAPYFIKAYTLAQNNQEYRQYAALAYMAIKEESKALALANEILSSNQYDVVGWSVRLHYAIDPLAYINEIPEIVRTRTEFKLNAFFTLARDTENMRIVFLPGSPTRIDIQENTSNTINYANFRFWLRYSDYLFSQIYFEFPMITNYAESEELKQAPIYQYFFKLMNSLAEIIGRSECGLRLAQYRFRYHYARLIMTGDHADIHHLEKTYTEIEEKDHIHATQLIQAYELIGTQEYRDRSLEIIESFGMDGHELLALFKTVILFNSGKDKEAIEFYEQYILRLKDVSMVLINNLLQFFRMGYRKSSERALDFLDKVLTQCQFPNQELRTLLNLYVRSIYAAEQIELTVFDDTLDAIEIAIDPKYHEIRQFYLTTLRQLKAYDRVIRFLRPTSGGTVDSNDLLFYCEALYHSIGNKAELLQVLKKARLELAPNEKLLQLEIELRQRQRNWKKVMELAEYGLKHFKPSPNFICTFFNACLHELNLAKILEYQHVAKGISMTEQGHLVVFSAFSQAGLHHQAIDILYESAIDRSNVASRQAFVTSTLRSGEVVFKTYDEVISGSYVTYKVSGETFRVFVDPAKLNDPAIKPFLGRKIEEHFQLYSGFMQETTFVHITRITDKYLQLYDDILNQAANPVAGLKLKQFQFEGTTADEMKASLQRHLGASGTMDKQFREQNMERYNSGQITFSELIKGNFRNNAVDAYYFLTANRQTYFQTPPQTIPHEPIAPNTKFVLDLTTITLLYELTKEFDLHYSEKFIISNYVDHHLKHLLHETLSDVDEKMSLSITMESVIPHFFPLDYKEKRSNHFRDMLTWVEEYCEVDHVDEKLDLVVSDKLVDLDDEDYLIYLLDNRLLSLRPNYLLITSDLFYLKVFGGQKRIIGPEVYLQKHFPEFNTAEYLLSKNYVGLKITKENLIQEYPSFITGRPSSYLCAIENLKINRSGANARNLSEGILFLKWLYLQQLIFKEGRYRTAHYLLNNMIQGLNERGFGFIINLISKQFALLPEAEKELLEILNDITDSI